jgi:hypothetical protein
MTGSMNHGGVKVLLDNGILSHAELAEPAIKMEEVQWGSHRILKPIHGFRRKPPHENDEYQRQIDAIFTIGRLIRDGRISAYISNEIQFESFRHRSPIKAFYALKGCNIFHCPTPIERSKFRKTISFGEHISKGGKKDRAKGVDLGSANQIPFMEWLRGLDESALHRILKHSKKLGLTKFEVESLKEIKWYKFICNRFRSLENFPDAFHLWTAERNHMDVFLTLEKKLPNLVKQIKQEKNNRLTITTEVLQPIEFICWMGVQKPDEVPIEFDKFYNYFEVD